jgi:hypothetical protein
MPYRELHIARCYAAHLGNEARRHYGTTAYHDAKRIWLTAVDSLNVLEQEVEKKRNEAEDERKRR